MHVYIFHYVGRRRLFHSFLANGKNKKRAVENINEIFIHCPREMIHNALSTHCYKSAIGKNLVVLIYRTVSFKIRHHNFLTVLYSSLGL